MGLLAVCAIALSACNLPRGAAMQSEIAREATAEQPTISVVPVTRAALPEIAAWPETGKQLRHRWIDGVRGPSSPTISAGDTLDIVVWDSQENSLLTNEAERAVQIKGLRVSPSGTIFVPYIDEVYVRGQTPEQARAEIQNRLTQIAPSAQVTVSLSAGDENTVDLVSGVMRPGRYPLPGRNYGILSLIAEGGGISPSVRNPVVRLQRGGQGYTIPARRLLSEPGHNALLRGGDRVIVEQDERYFLALGATGKEELVYFEKDEISALDALSIIGGLTDARANPKGVLVLREYPASAVRAGDGGPELPQVVFTIDLTSADGLFAARRFMINPEDVVLATESPVTSANVVFNLIGATLGIANRI
jgi:polysaccharide export outer membrane protein